MGQHHFDEVAEKGRELVGAWRRKRVFFFSFNPGHI
jgi:hypothetical protein